MTTRRIPHPTLLLALSALLVAALACTPLVAPPTVTPLPTSTPLPPTPTPLPPTPTTPLGGITLVNQSGMTVCYVNISLSTDQQWGEDWLGQTGTVPSGQSQWFDVPVGTYDMRAQDCEHALIGEAWQVDITADGFTWTLPYSPITVTMVNQSSSPVCYVLISPSTSQFWGSDWLGSSEIIDVGDSRDFAIPPGQQYDLQALDCNQNPLQQDYQIMVTEQGITWTVTGNVTTPTPQGQGGPPTVRLVNQGSVAVCFVYMSPSTQSTWGPNWMGASETVQSGASRDFSVPVGEQYDFRADDCDHNTLSTEFGNDITTGGYIWNVPGPG
jgi:hypothetical protein